MAKKRAVFVYSFSMINAGDFSLNIAAVDILIKNGFHVTLISRFEAYTREYEETSKYFKNLYGKKINMVSSPFKLDRSANKLTSLLNTIHSLFILFGLTKDRSVSDEIENSDIVVLCGGNILRCGSFIDYMRLQALNYPLALAKKHGKEYVIFPQSTAEINKIGERLLGRMVNGAKAVFLRERLSFEKITSLYPLANTIESLDLAFFLLDESIFKESNSKKSIAFTIRAGRIGGIGELPEIDKAAITKDIINIVLNLKNNNEITFVVQGDLQDKEITKHIQKTLLQTHQMHVNIIEEYDTFDLIKLYSGFDLLIGMRLHSIILAAIAGTPSYGFFRKEWGLKNPGILSQMNLPLSFVDDDKGVDLSEVEKLLTKDKVEFQNNIKKMVNENSDNFTNVLDINK